MIDRAVDHVRTCWFWSLYATMRVIDTLLVRDADVGG